MESLEVGIRQDRKSIMNLYIAFAIKIFKICDALSRLGQRPSVWDNDNSFTIVAEGLDGWHVEITGNEIEVLEFFLIRGEGYILEDNVSYKFALDHLESLRINTEACPIEDPTAEGFKKVE